MKVIDLETWQACFALELGATWQSSVRLIHCPVAVTKMATLEPVNPSAHKAIDTWDRFDDIEIEEIYLSYGLVYTSSEAQAVLGGYGPKSDTFVLYRAKE